MSRVGKKPVAIPEGVSATVNGNTIEVKGKNGTLHYTFPAVMTVKVEGNQIVVTRPDDEKQNRQYHGTVRALIQNMVTGVHDGYKKVLVLKGTGYKAGVEGSKVVLNVGYSTPIYVPIIAGCKVEVGGNNNTVVTVSGTDKQAVGQLAAQIREVRKPEPYLGKGIAYQDEHIRRKEGKKAGKK